MTIICSYAKYNSEMSKIWKRVLISAHFTASAQQGGRHKSPFSIKKMTID